MATLVVVLLWSKLFLSFFPPSECSTHWIVTEDGKLQAQVDSIFNLRRPYDLVALLKQEERALVLDELKTELLNRKDEIDRNEDKDTGLEQRFYKTDPDCLAAGKPLPDFDLYISTVLPLENKGIRPEEHIDFKASPATVPLPPDCSAAYALDFSLNAFEHLEGMKDRKNLNGTPELGLKNAITHRDNVDDYGHLIHEALKKNTTSWVLYNMAAFYWRIKGNPYNVVECLRRALHFSPRMQKDVALISLANILHRARYSSEAAIVVHSALDVSKELNVNHFTLGNIYAVLAEYNKSVICFENTLKIQPDFEAAAKRKHAVLCHAKLEGALEAQHRSLQRTLSELKDYQKKHERWQLHSEKFQTEQAPLEMKLDQKFHYEQHKIQESKTGGGEYCKMVDKDGRQVLKCSWGRRSSLMAELEPDDSREKEKKTENRKDNNETRIDYTKPIKPLRYTRKPQNPKKAHANLPFKDKHWPPKNECDMYISKFPAWNTYPTVYLPPENKGFEVEALLTEAQGLKPGAEHPLPWYPPVCVTLENIEESSRSYDHIEAVKERTKVPLKLFDPSVKHALLGHVNDGEITEEEVGQRILSALKNKIGPSWILYNLAGLYWRIIGNSYHGIECIRLSLYHCPERYKDVPLTNLANILYKWGRLDDAVKLMRDAVAVNDLEPLVHYFLGNLLSAKSNITGAIYHYEEALKQDPEHPGILHMLRVVKCYQKYHQSNQNPAKKDTPTSCQKSPGAPDGKETESRIVCRTENGKETCIVETRTRAKPNGQCPQMCPGKPDTCRCQCAGNSGSNTYSWGLAQKGILHIWYIARVKANTNKTTILMHNYDKRTVANFGMFLPVTNNDLAQLRKEGKTMTLESLLRKLQDGNALTDESCGSHGNGNQVHPFNMLIDNDLINDFEKLDQLYRDKGLCAGKECDRLNFVQTTTARPHIRLENLDGILAQNLVFADSPSEVKVEPNDCIIFNDGTKTDGCKEEVFKQLANQLSDFHRKFDEIDKHIDNVKSAKTKSRPSDSATKDIDRVTILQPVTMQDDDSPAEVELPEIKDSELPDTTVYISKKKNLPLPSWKECQERKKIDFKKFTSTWYSVGLDPKKHVDFSTVIKGAWKEPLCIRNKESVVESLSTVKGVMETNVLSEYSGEAGLKEVFQSLGGHDESEPVDVIGTRIADSLLKNSTSWVLGNLAALYWRVEGNAKKAIDCLKMALQTAPVEQRDISLLGIANILYKAGRLNDAVVVINLALKNSPKVVVIHFTLANIYAAKGDWPKAVMFYQSTLGLQSSFEPAKDRLHAIQCKKILEHPEDYKPREDTKKKG